MRPAARRITAAFGALALLLVLTGCNLAAKVVVQPDGSGYYSVIMTVPKAPSNPGQVLYRAVQQGATKSNIPLKVTPYSAGNNSGAMLTFHFLSLADLTAESHRLAAQHVGGIGVTINRDSTGWHFSAGTSGTILAPSGQGAGFTGGPINASELSSLLTIDLIVQLPGSPAENNAKMVTHTATSSTFTWILSSTQVGTTVQASTTFVGHQANVKLASALTAVHNPSSSGGGGGLSGGSMVLIVGGAVVLAAAVGTAVALGRRRKGTPPSDADPGPGPSAEPAMTD
jgi:hypothetical protein